MIERRTAESVLAKAISTGGDFAEIYLEDVRSNTVGILDGKIDTATSRRTHGACVRVFKGPGCVYVTTNDTSEQGLMRAAEQAADATGSLQKHSPVTLCASRAANIHPVSILPACIGGAERAALAHRAYKSAKDTDACISQVRASVSDTDKEICIANTEGLLTEDFRTYTRMGISAIAASGAENQVGYEAPGALCGYELFKTRVDVEQIARNAATRAATMLRADFCPAGFMPVVIDGGFGGVIFHEACGHSLEATSVAFGNSEFCNKLGQQIANPIVSAVDDGTLPNEWGSINIDDEGTPATKLVLIENGILKNYMIDKLNGRRMQMPVTGSARRQDYIFAPTSRMRNTYIAPGNDDDEEMIRTMGNGLYAASMGGGSVNPVTGEFNFAVSEGYLVKDGKIEKPVRGATLIGHGGEVLVKIDRVGKNMTMAQGMCGSSSGSIPTNVGQPRIRVSGMTVGGR
ncbi:MAG: TldD/PmbA family protein [Christensenellales bacterium]